MPEDHTTAPGNPGAAGGPVSERMQALLSRAVEDQLSEQRTVANALAEVRGQVAAVGEGLRGAASGVAVERLRTELAALATELRTSTTGLGERFDGLSQRLEEQGAALSSSGQDAAGLSGGLAALAADVAAHGAALQRMTGALTALASFPEALAALQRDVAGMHDRLTPLADVRATLADLQARTSTSEALRPEVEALTVRAQSLATTADVNRLRDSVVVAVAERLEALAARPAASAGDVDLALAPVHARLVELAEGGAAAEGLRAVQDRLDGLQEVLGQVVERVSQVGDAAGGIPAMGIDLRRLSERVGELPGLRADVTDLQTQLAGLSDGPPALTMAIVGLREDVEDLGSRVADLSVPGAAELAAAVSAQLADRLVDELGVRVADVVLDRIGPDVAEQVGRSVAGTVLDGVRTNAGETERRLRTHIDEAILALAEALLRRRRGLRTDPGVEPSAAEPALVEPDPAELGTELAQPEPAVPVEAAPAAGKLVPDEVLAPQDVVDAPADAQEPTGSEQPEGITEPEEAQEPEAESAPGRPDAALPHWQPAGDVLPATAAVPARGQEDEDERRRPWWRPGG